MILITGGSGFIGSHLIKALSSQDHDIVAVSRNIESKNIKCSKVTVKNADITKKEAFYDLPSGINSVIHLAAYSPAQEKIEDIESLLGVNAIGTSNVLNFCVERNCKHIIYSSTRLVYGPRHYKAMKETDSAFPPSSYGMSKLLGEWYCKKIGMEHGIAYSILRFCAIYGFGEDSTRHVLPWIFINQALTNKDIIVFGKGNSARDYLYVKDAVNAILEAYRKRKSGVYNIGPGYQTKVRDLARIVSTIFSGDKSKVIFDASKEETPLDAYLDISKARNELNFEPKYILENGLEDYYCDILIAKC